MENKYLVENCFILTPRDVGCSFDNIKKLGISSLDNKPEIAYWFDTDKELTYLFISVDGQEPQKFVWELVDIMFGERAYFHCSCGQRVSKLYLPPNSKEFRCRKCYNLKYELSTFNKNSVAGKYLYQANRLLKLANSRADMSRIFYKGGYTKRFETFLRLCDSAGLDSVVKGAQDLKALIHG